MRLFTTPEARRGQSMVEFALILPIFILLLVGIFDLGRAVYAYNTINNAAREAGRLAIVDQTVADIQARAAAQGVSLGIDPADVDVDFYLTSGGPGSACPQLGNANVVYCTAMVTVPYEYTAATPLIGNLVGTIVMTGQTEFQVASNCVAAPGPDCPLGD